MDVRWKNSMSYNCRVSNGVNQEEFPLIFFGVNIDDLSNKLNKVNAGCIIDSTSFNHLMYANDVVITVPSSLGLSMLLSVCSEYGFRIRY